MKKLFYPAIFHKEDDGFWVSFPDFPECLITSRKEEKEEIPSPSDPDVIDADGGIITVICFDMMEYLKRHSSKAVKKTLSIPEWLNEAACSMGRNFSQVLQEALLQKVQSKF